MRRLLFGCILAVYSLASFCAPKDGYYESALGKTGTDLKAALHTIIDGHLALPYTKSGNDDWTDGENIDVWEALAYTDSACADEVPDCDLVVTLYLGEIRSTDLAYRGGTAAIHAWEREHVWPKSRSFPKPNQDGYTDLHHLRPADRDLNNKHSNYGYDNGGQPILDKLEDSQTRETTAKLDKENKSFEPPNRAKGQVARMLFYMAVRYEPQDNTDEEKMSDLRIVDDNFVTKDPLIGDLCTLLTWHNMYSPSDFERRRNDRVEEIQGNRNPFIDQPGWANLIWGEQCSSL
ncbi:endonuclease I family protein [Agarivorans albus]|uniref:Extracellular ribonuclease n=1 Tax=Agarivorans albus MKT 106 TaxID=1331007 RepID=R9PMP5_AGAAL|nr:endonuclease [Agarivorans albus]GAD02662.1 extracellular ribonuclease precursor [Agarivorans albus MKT 106]